MSASQASTSVRFLGSVYLFCAVETKRKPTLGGEVNSQRTALKSWCRLLNINLVVVVVYCPRKDRSILNGLITSGRQAGQLRRTWKAMPRWWACGRCSQHDRLRTVPALMRGLGEDYMRCCLENTGHRMWSPLCLLWPPCSGLHLFGLLWLLGLRMVMKTSHSEAK